MNKKTWIFAAFIALAALSRAYGTVVLPYTFSPNTPIPAAGVNANDGALRDEINSHEASRNAHQTRLQDILALNNSCGAYSVNFNLQQALNMEVENLSADPSPGNQGRLFVNTTDHNLKYDNGSTIVTIAGTGVNNLAAVLNSGNSAGTHNLDMNEQQLLHARTENLSSAPSAGNAGRIYWDTVLQSLYIDTGAAWVAIGGAQGLASVLGVSNSAGATNINFNQNQAKNMVLDKLSSDPGSPVEGQAWYNTTTHIPKYYNGTANLAVGNTNTLAQTVALGNSTGGDVNFGSHQATNLVLFNNSGSPGTGTGGFVWYDTGDNQIHFETSSANHAVCSLDQTQTLTNKTIDGGSNTLTNIGDGSLSANVDLLNGAQTISAKKTFSSAPQIARIKTASATTSGHVVPDVADDTFTLDNASQTLANKVLAGATMSANLDFAEFQATHFRVENFSGTPTVGHAGRIYLNTGDGQLHFDDGTNWHTIGVDVPNLSSILAIGNSAGSNSIDFNNNQGLNMLLENLGADPSAAHVGRVYINTVDHHAHLDTGTKILALTDSLTPNTTKGDIQASNGTDNVRFPVGSDGNVLSADSSQSSGLRWVSPLTNPMSTLGDMIVGGALGAVTRLAGDTSNTRKFLRELSSGGVATTEVWDTLVAGDIPSLAASIITSGTLADARGGTNSDSSAATGIAHVASGAWTYSAVNLANTDVTGVLPLANGGTGSAAPTGLTGTAASNIMMSASPTTTGTLTGAAANWSGAQTNSTNGASATPALKLSGTPDSADGGTANKALLLLEDAATSNSWSTNGTYLGINAKTGFTGNLIQVALNMANRFSVDSTGKVSAGGEIDSGNAAGFKAGSTGIFYQTGSTLIIGNTGSGNPAGVPQIQMANLTDTNTSGTDTAVEITPTYNQASATTANTDLLINRTETSVGSGAQNLIDAQVAASSKFKVDNTGVVTTKALRLAAATKTANYPIVAADSFIFMDINAGNQTATLPTAVGASGQVYAIIASTAGSGHNGIINTTSAQTIGGIASGAIKMATANDELVVVSDGSNWQILSININVAAVYTVTSAASQALTSTGVHVRYDTKVEDNLLLVTTGVSWVYTAMIPGEYSLDAQLFSANTSSGSWQIQPMKNAANIIGRCENSAQFAGGSSLSTNQEASVCHFTTRLAAGDTLWMDVGGAATTANVYTNPGDSFISISRIGN